MLIAGLWLIQTTENSIKNQKFSFWNNRIFRGFIVLREGDQPPAISRTYCFLSS